MKSLWKAITGNPEKGHPSPSAGSGSHAAPGTYVGETSSLHEGGRFHTKIGDRYITLFRINDTVSAIDSVCFHAGGPLGIGDIEDLNGKTCVVCPWHYYKIDLKTGDKYYQAVDFKDGKLVGGEWKSNGVKQRVHKVVESGGKIYVELGLGGDRVESDEYACNAPCGERVLRSPPSASKMKLHSVGGDGKKPSGQVVQQAREAAQQAAATAAAAAAGPSHPPPVQEEPTQPAAGLAEAALADRLKIAEQHERHAAVMKSSLSIWAGTNAQRSSSKTNTPRTSIDLAHTTSVTRASVDLTRARRTSVEQADDVHAHDVHLAGGSRINHAAHGSTELGRDA